MVPSVLIVDDEKHTREGLQQALVDSYDVSLAASADEAFNLMDAQPFDVIVTDLRMPGKSGLKVIDKALAQPNRPAVLMMTAYGNIETAVEAMKRGAVDFLTKPVNIERLEVLIQRALKAKTLEVEVKQLHERLDEKFSFEGIIGNSPKLHEVIDRVKLVAPSRATILIEGESGTGKELIAQAIHQSSSRSRGPFLAVHCAALSENLLESELFGHERGSFTGATERRIGRFESADGGTLFLDEIGEISASTQVKLLRFLETKSIERVGGSKPIDLDVRLVAATNRTLEQLVRDGKFREDLFFRLNVVRITMPPLRERAEDVPLLLGHYITAFSEENGVPPLTIEPGALATLQAYPWPGNIRELRNFCENAVVLRRGRSLSEYDLEPRYRDATLAGATGPAPTPGAPGSTVLGGAVPTSFSVEENEKRLLREALIKSRGNRTKAAELMGISRRTLHRKIAQWPELDVVD
ncbi:sigma-54-dependent transcriptional regulator [Opitutus terrae]|uniref:Two component, sigma54 specific, transcriptional regulator, Fis family n=1 Tax=Opitutus terrae (strain DSM 11246 / JCM 15787 / PB90-1) TaxID=452637 RepID=B1ZMV8_OPITP|nr:sigma-54 dependent transcriptional regulator [Opitutus terrae]ACB75386.1 two component, sigma54 specific, transcriptional regulator, Fis family [Opitutus terrae PB90-1]